jgi:hypothetical protein
MSLCGKKNVAKSKKVRTAKYFQENDNMIQVLWDNSVPGVTLLF